MSKSFPYAVVAFVGSFVLYVLGAWIDCSLNPWINNLSLDWWSIFTTPHYVSWLFLHDRLSFIVISIIGSGLIATGVFLIYRSKEK